MSDPDPMSPGTECGLVPLLLSAAAEAGCRDDTTLREAMSRAAFAQQSLVGAVLNTGLVPENDFLLILARMVDLPWRNEEQISTAENIRQLFPARLALGFQILPEAFPEEEAEEGRLRLLIWDPFDHAAWQALAHHHAGPCSW